MKARSVWIVTVDEPVFYGRLYQRLIDSAPGCVAGVIILPSLFRRNSSGLVSDLSYRFRFWGARGFLHSVTRVLLARIRKTGDPASAARRHGIAVARAQSIGHAVLTLKSHGADVVLATVNARVRQADLDAIPGGWVNTHCGPLPRYAGVDAPFWCLYHMEPTLTVTLHYMQGEFDAGPIISQASIANDRRPYFPLVDELFNKALALHEDFLRTGVPAIVEAKTQDLALRTYFGKPPIAKGREFRRRGGRFV